MKVYVDGSSLNNPGHAGAAFVIGDKVFAFYLGQKTNNQAEYWALILALNYVKEERLKGVVFLSDSQLMVKQVKGEYKVKNAGIRQLWEQVKALWSPDYKIEWIEREKNVADVWARRVAHMGRAWI
jgi:ribonuclease HI